MIKLPEYEKRFEYENNFILSCDNSRIGKMLAHYELFKLTQELPGAIIECGVFKGASLIRFASFRDLFECNDSRKIIGFDIFGKFPETNFKDDEAFRDNFILAAGEESISENQLFEVLNKKGVDQNIELIKGDITETIPEYIKNNPYLKISLVNLDTDIYEPAVTVLENLWPRIVKGGILVLDDYGVFPGETKAVDEFFKEKNVKIRKFKFSLTPSYIVKE
ncbi:TylF/MycF/NovP-related O-methyltransferase [Eubacteriaceae bacterium ES3]|nr:TylF/MycF/NovP-related O-methyltransferase [Eubacteriaceae bacterium ES3]